MELKVHFIGTSATLPSSKRGMPALVIERGPDKLLFDCGEGTQRQLALSGVGLVDFDNIFITHAHADHFLGLPGLLGTYGLRERKEDLNIYGPAIMEKKILAMREMHGLLNYKVVFNVLNPGDVVRFDDYEVRVFKPNHGGDAIGYKLVEDFRRGTFDLEKAASLGITPGPDFGRLTNGETLNIDGNKITAADVIGSPRPGRTIVYTGDTTYSDEVVDAATGVDLLIHDSTFARIDNVRAKKARHSTSTDAARVAKKARVSFLALNHIANRGNDKDILNEARKVFTNCRLMRDFDVIEIPFPEKGKPFLMKKEVDNGNG